MSKPEENQAVDPVYGTALPQPTTVDPSHAANKLSCRESSIPVVRTPDSWFLMPIPCFRHNLLTSVEMRFW